MFVPCKVIGPGLHPKMRIMLCEIRVTMGITALLISRLNVGLNVGQSAKNEMFR